MDTRGLLNDAPAPPPEPGRRDDPVQAPWGVTDIIAALLLTLTALAMITVLFVILGLLGLPLDAPKHDPVRVNVEVLGQVLLDLSGVAAAVTLSLRKYNLTPRAWGLRRQRPVAVVPCVVTLVVSFLSVGLYFALAERLGIDLIRPKPNVPKELFESSSVLPGTILLVVIVAPICEEVFFRGFVFNGLRSRLGVLGAALVSGLMFAAIHGQIGLLIPFTVIGAAFAVLIARTGSLANSIVVHLTFNLIGVIAQLGSGTGLR